MRSWFLLHLKGHDWKVKSIKEKGSYHVRATICVIENGRRRGERT